jgi:hypothetical protein
MVNYGSPIFGTYWRDARAKGMHPSDVLQHLMSLVKSKLLCSPKIVLPANISKCQAWALLGPTIQPRLNGALHLNSELISSHAAHCDFILPSRDLIVCNYPSQFTLACGANQILANNKILICCIKELTATLRLGLDARGTAGELASRIILSCAMRNAMGMEGEAEMPYGCSVRFVTFLKALTGDPADTLLRGESISDEHRTNHLENGMVF